MPSFDGFMRIESLLRSFYRLVYLNLLWMLSVAVGLMVFSIGPASYAVARYLDGWFRRGDTPPTGRAFVRYLREGFTRSVVLSWVLMAVGGVCAANILLSSNWYVQFANLVILAMTLMVASYVFCIMAATDITSVRQLLASAFLVGLGSLHWTIVGSTVTLLAVWAAWQLSPLLLLALGVTLPAIGSALVTRVVFREFVAEPDRDARTATHLTQTPSSAAPRKGPSRFPAPRLQSTSLQSKGMA